MLREHFVLDSIPVALSRRESLPVGGMTPLRLPGSVPSRQREAEKRFRDRELMMWRSMKSITPRLNSTGWLMNIA